MILLTALAIYWSRQ